MRPQPFVLPFVADYDNGFLIRPVDPQKHPFELQLNAWIQFRHNAFSRDVDTYTDNAGVTRPVRNRNNFDIERARLIFSGYAISPRLDYFLHLDGDTDGRESVDFFDYWWGYRFHDALKLQFGKRKVPGSRQWLLSARRTRFVDRPMANDFFRPDRSTGIFAIGDLAELLHYELGFVNGYNTANRSPAEVDDHFGVSGTMFWDPLGSYGPQIVDYSCSERPLVRVGHSLTYASQSDLGPNGQLFGEADFVRLSDGTRLTDPGALAPGVTVSDFDIYFYGIDVAAKWHGWSINAEAFFRWLQALSGDGPLPRDSLDQRGFYVEGGYFLIPKRLDANLRYSRVSGVFGDASEYAVGMNWYPIDTHKVKVSFDVTALDGSPLNNTSTDILVGDDGTLFRTQFQAEF